MIQLHAYQYTFIEIFLYTTIQVDRVFVNLSNVLVKQKAIQDDAFRCLSLEKEDVVYDCQWVNSQQKTKWHRNYQLYVTVRPPTMCKTHTASSSIKGPEITNVKNSNEKTNGRIYVQINERNINMLRSNKRQPLNHRLLTWDRHTQNVAGLNKRILKLLRLFYTCLNV